MKPDLQERRARIETEARTLARSGKYRSFITIKMMLLARGYSEAHKIFANRWTQSELDRLCRQAQDAVMRGEGGESSAASSARGAGAGFGPDPIAGSDGPDRAGAGKWRTSHRRRRAARAAQSLPVTLPHGPTTSLSH